MEMLLGARPYDFVDEATKRNIAGVSVFIADDDAEGAVGYVSDKVSMTNADFKAVFGTLAEFEKIVTKPVVISYNKRGKPVAYELVAQK